MKTSQGFNITVAISIGLFLCAIYVIFSFYESNHGLSKKDSAKIEYAKQNELVQIFLEYYPQAETEFNADKNKVTFKVEKEDKRLYIQIPAKEGVNAEEVLYCYAVQQAQLIFSEGDKEKIIEKLKNNECLKNYQSLADELKNCFKPIDDLSADEKQKLGQFMDNIDDISNVSNINSNDSIETLAYQFINCRNNILNPLSIEEQEKIFDVWQEENYYPDY